MRVFQEELRGLLWVSVFLLALVRSLMDVKPSGQIGKSREDKQKDELQDSRSHEAREKITSPPGTISFPKTLLPALRCSTCPKAPAHPHRTGTASCSVGMCHDTYQALTVTRPNLGIVDPKLSGGGFMEQSGGLGKQSQSL